MTNINDIATKFIEGYPNSEWHENTKVALIHEFASYLSSRYILAPKEEVKEELLGTDDSDWVKVKLYGFRKNGVTTITREEIIKPQEPVKVKHACDVANCTGIRFPLLDNKTLCEYEQHIRDTFYKYQPPSNKSTGVKIEPLYYRDSCLQCRNLVKKVNEICAHINK